VAVHSNFVFEGSKVHGFVSPFDVPLKERIPTFHKKKRIIVIAGPTGVGKTHLSLMIARAIGGEIVSADSMQVYRGMDIGTAKVTPQERDSIRHHLIDSRDLDETFNVVEFYNEAMQSFKEIFARDHVPIVVGGTGFYIHSLIYGPPCGPASVAEVRDKLEQEMEALGSLNLYERLKKLDAEYAATITFRDRHKIVRALEIITLTNKKVSFFEKSCHISHEYDFRCWFVYMPKEVLYPRIEMRCDKMLTEGFLQEVKQLDQEGLRYNTTAAQAIGYRQCLDFLDSSQGVGDWNKFVEAFKQASRRYAKRQFTWFRKEELFRWVDINAMGLDHTAEMIIQDYELYQ
jgi:tRNA dimethylallyltransferase